MKIANILLAGLATLSSQAVLASEQHWTSPPTETQKPHYSHTYTITASYRPAALPVGSGCDGYEGQWNCMTTSWQRCASGRWSVIMPVAEGSMCQPAGRSFDFAVVDSASGSLTMATSSSVSLSGTTTMTASYTAATPSTLPGGGYSSSATTSGSMGTNNGFVGGTAAAGTGLAMAQRGNGGSSLPMVGAVGMMAVVFARLLI